MENATVYGGKYIVGTDYIYGYGLKTNVPKNIHDISKARLSYSVSATNLRRMMPKLLWAASLVLQTSFSYPPEDPAGGRQGQA